MDKLAWKSKFGRLVKSQIDEIQDHRLFYKTKVWIKGTNSIENMD